MLLASLLGAGVKHFENVFQAYCEQVVLCNHTVNSKMCKMAILEQAN